MTVKGPAPSERTLKANIAFGQSALKRGLRVLARPGIALRETGGVPLYWIDPNDPGLFVRRLDRREERGRLVDGIFQVVE